MCAARGEQRNATWAATPRRWRCGAARLARGNAPRPARASCPRGGGGLHHAVPARRAHRAGIQRVDRDAMGPEFLGEAAHDRQQCRVGRSAWQQPRLRVLGGIADHHQDAARRGARPCAAPPRAARGSCRTAWPRGCGARRVVDLPEQPALRGAGGSHQHVEPPRRRDRLRHGRVGGGGIRQVALHDVTCGAPSVRSAVGQRLELRGSRPNSASRAPSAASARAAAAPSMPEAPVSKTFWSRIRDPWLLPGVLGRRLYALAGERRARAEGAQLADRDVARQRRHAAVGAGQDALGVDVLQRRADAWPRPPPASRPRSAATSIAPTSSSLSGSSRSSDERHVRAGAFERHLLDAAAR